MRRGGPRHTCDATGYIVIAVVRGAQHAAVERTSLGGFRSYLVRSLFHMASYVDCTCAAAQVLTLRFTSM